MAADALLLAIGSAGCIGGVAVLRLAWSRPQRSTPMNLTGWGVLGAGLVAWTVAGGAWGIAVGASMAMLTAGLLLATAALTDGPGGARAPRTPRPTVALHAKTPLALGRRVGVFLIVVPGALAAAMLIALAGQMLARGAGWVEADSIAFGLMLFPVAWTILVLSLMFRERLRRAIIDLAVVSSAAGAMVLAFS